MKKKSVLTIAQCAALIAIILIMTVTPFGYLKIGTFEIALVTIPVVVGAMTVGPFGGLILGAAFGITSYLSCFGILSYSAFGAALLEVNPFYAFLMCIPTRMLMGYLTGLLFQVFRKMDRTNTWCYFLTGLIGALLNTVFFMGVLILCYWNCDYIVGLRTSIAAENILAFLVAMVGLNGLVEMGTCCVLGGTVSKVLNKVIKRSSDGEYV